MDHWSLDLPCKSRAVCRRSSSFTWSCERNLVVHNKVEASTNSVVRHLGELQGLLVHALASKGSIPVHLDAERSLSHPL